MNETAVRGNGVEGQQARDAAWDRPLLGLAQGRIKETEDGAGRGIGAPELREAVRRSVTETMSEELSRIHRG